MEGDDGPSAIGNKPTVIKAAQEEMGRLDVLVCGQCHSVFHFVEEFQEHRTKEGACSKTSRIRDTNDNGQKAQVWAFLLWKDTQVQDSSDKEASNAWTLYQKWCKMDTKVKEAWVTAGKTIQTFTKISNAKMQDTLMQSNTNVEGAKPIIVRKVVRNGQPEETGEAKKDSAKSLETKTQKIESMEIEVDKKEKPRLKPSIKPKIKSGKATTEEDANLSNEEYIVDKILAKRFNTKKRCSEYLIKWEGYPHENNTWESAEAVAACKSLLDEFERSLAKQKESKAAQQHANTKVVGRVSLPLQKSVIKAETSQPGPSTAAQVGRPMRSSKSKAMDQVKQWCGSMKDEENELLGKRRIDDSESDSEEGGSSAAKRTKGDTGSDDEWTGESEDERLLGRSDVIQRAFNRANAQSNGSNRTSVSSTDLATSLGLQSPDGAKSSQPPVLVASAKGVVKVDPKQMPNLASGLYVMSRKDGIIKLNSSPSGKLAVKGSSTQGVVMVQNRDNTNVIKKQVISTSQSNSMTPVKVVSKMDGSQVVTQMKVVTKAVTPKMSNVQKSEPIKIQPKPDPSQLQQIHVVAAVPTPITLQPRIPTGVRSTPVTPQRTVDGRPLLPRPSLRPTATTSVLGTIRTPVRAPAPRQIQAQVTRPVLQKRTTTVVSTQQTVSPVVTVTGTVTQIRPKFTVLTTSPQSKQVIKTGTNPVQSQQPPTPSSQQTKQSSKTPIGKAQSSLLSPQQKLLMVKRKAQEAAGIKPGGRGLLAGARTVAGRGRAKISTETPSIGQTGTKPPKESKLAEGDGLHMEFHEVGSEESSSEDESDLPPAPEPDAITAPEPDSPPRPFTLCPLTGRIIGPDGEPIEQPDEPETSEVITNSAITKTVTNTSETTSADLATTVVANANTSTITPTTTTTTVTAAASTNATAELVLPSLDSLTESGGIMRVEMSPGGTTGTIVQDSETAQINLSNVTISAPDLPCLDDTASTVVVTAAPQPVSTATSLTETVISSSAETSITTVLSTVPATSTVTMSMTTADVKAGEKIPEEKKITTNDASNLVTIAEHGVVYQVASQAEDGQTLLVTHGADGEQQCVYVTTEQQGDDGSVLTLDHAVAEAVAQLIPDQVNLTPQFYVKEDGAEPTENSMVMSIMDNTNASDVSGNQEDNDGHNEGQSVIAQVVQAEEPTPGGTRRVVLLLPDGNLMMTEVDEDQYAALELDK
ncbi:PREDICTED: serine-rich adhesin for platelets isoform X1 [Atta colombica]|uniref:serine-rich adhesin for platelets isoform X1 n=1 Tax=Atta colombica TaxID=520822 RepID=UPI00084C6D94|nr:PREDICTED: serine-rich adhesin for platelets isoform X1 [Atta colombica]XP_018056744.1 PREDICTED: serine-rich adhesin for platelets isoform X1 [Atta colombica]XP_018056746.1 PREDICTED: serine-rich adhesin for platelets isoform X1 [Atta colombica]XP_018056747.1 PREDICTED: serine-rich adhesin for platelets isoform X1 [Atta colombica]